MAFLRTACIMIYHLGCWLFYDFNEGTAFLFVFFRLPACFLHLYKKKCILYRLWTYFLRTHIQGTISHDFV